MKILSFLVALAAFTATAGWCQEPRQELRRTLEDQGLATGLVLSGLRETRDIFLPGPAGVADQGTISLSYLANFPGYRTALLEILVNDSPRRVVDLAAQPAEALELPLLPTDLTASFLKLSLRLRAAITRDACFDQRVAAGSLTIRPDSGARFRLRGNPADLRGAVAALPHRVTVALTPQGGLDTALAILSVLRRTGHEVAFGPTGQVTVAPDGTPAGASLADGAIRISGTAAAAALVPPFAGIARTGTLALGERPQLGGRPTADGSITLGELGAGFGERIVADRAEWIVPVSVRDMPAGFLPIGAKFDLIAAVPAEEDAPLVQIYQGDILLRSLPLDHGGAPQRLSVDLPSGLLTMDNSLRVQVLRRTRSAECGQAGSGLPMQLLPTSIITAGRTGSDARSFALLAAAFKETIPLYLPEAWRGRTTELLPVIGATIAALVPRDREIRVVFAGDGPAPAPDRPFIALGSAIAATTPIRLESGRARIVGSDGKTLLDLSPGNPLAMAEIGQANGQPGLILRTTAGDPPLGITQMVLDRGDVAFLGPRGTDFAFDSRGDTVLRIVDPQAASLLDWLGIYRYWLFAAAWVAGTALFIYLLKKVRQHRLKA